MSLRFADLAGRRVAVWGYGHEGRAALAALRARLPRQAVTLFCSATEAASVATPGVQVVSQAPDAAALAAFDIVIKSPGISLYRPEVRDAAQAGVRFTSGTALWFGEHPRARVIAITGTKGKSTVTALVAHLLRALGRQVALAGNIGLPLLELLDPPRLPDWWVVELSSFQTREAVAVDVGVLNNLYEEHLDWHGSRARYAADKLALAAVSRSLVVNASQPELLERTTGHPDRHLFGDAEGWHLDEGGIWRAGQLIVDGARSPLPGAHNAANLCAALAAIEAAGEDACAAAPAVASFRPLPHRLQTLGDREGLTWVDDSIATTPQATLEALASLDARRVTVLVGGFDRALDWRHFAEVVRDAPPHAIVTMGANGPRIRALLAAVGGGYCLEAAATVADAVGMARALTPKGGVVLLSPGAPSFDQYANYAERGCDFAALAGFDPAMIGAIQGLGIA